jgi:hypothetical protein
MNRRSPGEIDRPLPRAEPPLTAAWHLGRTDAASALLQTGDGNAPDTIGNGVPARGVCHKITSISFLRRNLL